MSTFACTRCGASMPAPAPGATGVCPNCGLLFETPAGPPRSPYAARRDPRDAGEDGYAPVGRPRHSGLGVASFIVGTVVLVIGVIVTLLAVVVGGKRGNHGAAEAMGVMAGIFTCFGLAGSLVGLGLGVGGIFQEDRNRTFAVLGLVLNGLVFLAGMAVFLIGVALAARGY